VHCLVDTLAVLFDTLSQLFIEDSSIVAGILPLVLLVWCIFFVVLKLVLDSLEFFPVKREHFSTPLPLKIALTVVLITVKDAAGADLFIDYGDGLKSVGEDNIGVHCCHIDVINERLFFKEGALITDLGELVNNFLLDLLVVLNILRLSVSLDLDGEAHDLVNPIDELLVAVLAKLELDRDVTPVYTLLQALDSSSNVGV